MSRSRFEQGQIEKKKNDDNGGKKINTKLRELAELRKKQIEFENQRQCGECGPILQTVFYVGVTEAFLQSFAPA